MRSRPVRQSGNPRRRIGARCALAAAAILVALGLAGCASGSGRGSRGSVSDAAAKAAEPEARQRGDGTTRTKTDHQAKHEQDDDSTRSGASSSFSVGVGGGYSGTASAAGTTKSRRPNLIGAFNVTYPAGDTIDRVSTGSVAFSRYEGRRFRWHVGAYFGNDRRGANELVQGGIGSLQEAGLEIGFRNYLAADHTAVGLYLLYGLRLGGLFWSYSRPVETGSGDETIDSDAVFMTIPFAGFGCAFLQTKDIQLALNGTAGYRLGSETTLEDYTNDLFRFAWDLGWRLEMTVFF